jgi:hypothetical protein
MTDTKHTDNPEDLTGTGHSRRRFLGIAGTGVAGMTGAALLNAAPAAAADEQTTDVPAGTPPLVAYVADARTGHLVVMHGEREVSIHDRKLAARLARAARNGA